MLTVSQVYALKPEKLLDAVVATGASQPKRCPPGRKIFQIAITTTATVKIQGTVDGTNWDDLYTTTASKTVELDDLYVSHRANVTAWSAGAVSVTAAAPVVQ